MVVGALFSIVMIYLKNEEVQIGKIGYVCSDNHGRVPTMSRIGDGSDVKNYEAFLDQEVEIMNYSSASLANGTSVLIIDTISELSLIKVIDQNDLSPQGRRRDKIHFVHNSMVFLKPCEAHPFSPPTNEKEEFDR
ncbi:hypothetical protein [Phaeocystidibacter marisrubri]|uniref:Uncharacterized protein n=1 Tax=Phaeocystidibacter marisrubri TaxID=1577780 RepID=A0A6L3ZFF6_9FLAO|nr:hypothetical protein [Phaeocystidibacter marisrubri]KAB2816605.1 hypothetical protein F8C82_13060 [Phaeocystidibacter marisrubri]